MNKFDWLLIIGFTVFALCLLFAWGVDSGIRHARNHPIPLPTQRYEVKDACNHVIYSYEAHSNHVLSQSPDLKLVRWEKKTK